ncbi:MAG: hypothetical protein QOE22_440 [Candidatus Parcubacteria bacterium]|jgi:hypothetical protein|nr:hypothetical protein [Candidatus Parcubacteria bacterium]
MIHILGGASRSGKTLLARRAVSEKGVPYFPLDALFGGLANGTPQLGIAYDQPFIERAERMWPVAKPLLGFFFHEERDFLIEGDSILPSQVSELMLEGHQIRSCFIGYAALNKEEKLALVRVHHQGQVDWTKGHSDEEMLKLIEEMIQFSKYLEAECGKYGIQYFDISHDFEKPREQAFSYLFADQGSKVVPGGQFVE